MIAAVFLSPDKSGVVRNVSDDNKIPDDLLDAEICIACNELFEFIAAAICDAIDTSVSVDVTV